MKSLISRMMFGMLLTFPGICFAMDKTRPQGLKKLRKMQISSSRPISINAITNSMRDLSMNGQASSSSNTSRRYTLLLGRGLVLSHSSGKKPLSPTLTRDHQFINQLLFGGA